MSIVRTIICNIKDCKKSQTETVPNEGWRGWGMINGKQDDVTKETEFALCPTHLNKIFEVIKNGLD